MSSAEQMQMQMVDGLSAIGAGIDDEPIAVLQLFPSGNLRGCGDEMPQHGGVFGDGLFGGGQVLLRNDQQMVRSLWVEVGKGKDKIVLVDAFDGNGAGSDLAKDAVGGRLRGCLVGHGGSVRRSHVL